MLSEEDCLMLWGTKTPPEGYDPAVDGAFDARMRELHEAEVRPFEVLNNDPLAPAAKKVLEYARKCRWINDKEFAFLQKTADQERLEGNDAEKRRNYNLRIYRKNRIQGKTIR